jgi:hypothetical protein
LSYAKPIARPTFGFCLAAHRNHNTLVDYHVYWFFHVLRIGTIRAPTRRHPPIAGNFSEAIVAAIKFLAGSLFPDKLRAT